MKSLHQVILVETPRDFPMDEAKRVALGKALWAEMLKEKCVFLPAGFVVKAIDLEVEGPDPPKAAEKPKPHVGIRVSA